MVLLGKPMGPDRVPNKTKHSHQHRVANPRAKANISSRSNNNNNNQPNIKARAKAVKVANMQAKVAATAQAKFFTTLGQQQTSQENTKEESLEARAESLEQSRPCHHRISEADAWG